QHQQPWLPPRFEDTPRPRPRTRGRLVYNAATLRLHAPPFPSQLSLPDGDMMQPSQPPLRVSPRLCSQLAQDFALRLGPEGPRHRQRSSPFRCEPHRLDPPVSVGSTLEHAVALQEGKAARQGRLVNGELVLQLLQDRLSASMALIMRLRIKRVLIA